MSLTKATFSMIEGAAANILDYGADPTGVADSTAAIQAALDSGINNVYIPSGTYLFSTLIVNKNTRLQGASTRTSILKHTGAAIAIECIYSGSEPDGRGEYIDNGWFIFEDFELMVNGTAGFSVGKTRSTLSQWHNIHMRHRRDLEAGDPNNQYFPGSTAINCDNAPWVNYPTWLNQVNHCFMRGFENGVNLNDTVNAWQINQLYTIECKNHIVLNKSTGITMSDCYFESGIVAAQGIVFGSGGGNKISILDTTFELTNVAATQYAYNFTAGNSNLWDQISPINCKYLIQNDGNSVNSRRIAGTAPQTFVEINRTYLNNAYGILPMLWQPQSSAGLPLAVPNMRIGGLGQTNGNLLLSRSDNNLLDSVLYQNTFGEMSLQSASNVYLAAGQGNTTTITWTAGLLTGATSGTLTGNWTFASGTYVVYFSNSPIFDSISCTFTNGSTAVTFSRGLAANAGTTAYANGIRIDPQWSVFNSDKSFSPYLDNAYAMGQAGRRCSVVYSASGAINTSDANEKKDIIDISEVEKRVASHLKLAMKRFKFKDGKRYHFGIIAQEVKKAFESEGLIAEEYGVFCSDILENGSIRLGVRYDELFAFIISTL